MNTTLAERLNAALKARDMSGQGLEKAAKWPRGYSPRVLSGERRKLNADLLRRAAEVLRVNYDWLSTGRGDMDDPSIDTSDDPRLASLQAAVTYHAGRWTAATVAAAKADALASGEERDPQSWTERLDKIESALTVALGDDTASALRKVEALTTPAPKAKGAPKKKANNG